MDQSEAQDAVLRQIARTGGAVPDGMNNAPEIETGLHLYWRAFWDLCSCRDVDVPIPWRDTQLWIETYRLDLHQAEMTHEIIRRMDKAFLAHVNKRRERERAKREAEEASKGKRGRR